MKVNKFLISTVIVQSVLIIGLWYGPAAQPARAEIPDEGAQQAQIVQLLTDSNAKLDNIIEQLQHGSISVKVENSDSK